MMTLDDLKKMDAAALKNEVASLRKELFNLKLGMITGQVKDTSQFKMLRVSIAQALTLVNQQARSAGIR